MIPTKKANLRWLFTFNKLKIIQKIGKKNAKTPKTPKFLLISHCKSKKLGKKATNRKSKAKN